MSKKILNKIDKFERNIRIKYWFTSLDELDKLSNEQVETLENQTLESINRFITENGYTSGELCESIGDFELYGWWEFSINRE